MYVNSPGGSVTAGKVLIAEAYFPFLWFLWKISGAYCALLCIILTGMAIFDTMRHIRPDVSTVCVGLAARYVFLPRILALDVKLDVKSLCTFLIFLWN